MFKFEYHHPGTAPATLLPRVCAAATPPKITLIRYSQELFEEFQPATFEELDKLCDPGRINWINIDGLGDIELLRKLGEKYGLHPLALEDVLNTAQRPKVESYGGYYFIVTEMLYASDEGTLTFEQVSMFLTQDAVITIQEESGGDVFDRVRERLRVGKGFARKAGHDYLCYALLDRVVDQFFPILESLGDDIEGIEEEMLEKPSVASLKELYAVKRLLLQLRRAAWPQREIFGALMRDDTGQFTKDTQFFLRDCYDHTTQIIDMIESYRDLAAGLMDVYLSSLGLRTNEIMRVLTVISSVFIPLTFIAGVYGMNFDTDSPYNMPELKWRFGYFACLGLMLLIACGMLLFFKRKKWL